MNTPPPRPQPNTLVRYEVESELNPRYAETGNQEDYYGVYHVVKYEADTREIIETYPAGYANARFVAYRHAARLNAATSMEGDCMDELTKLERDLRDLNIQIEAIARLLSDLQASRQTIYDQIQETIATRPTPTVAIFGELTTASTSDAMAIFSVDPPDEWHLSG